MGQVVIVAYRPKPGADAPLLDLLREHLPILRGEGLVTDRAPVIVKSRDGTYVEVFEWASAEAVEAAHTNPVVGALWARFFELCDCVPLVQLAESQDMFATFEPVDR